MYTIKLLSPVMFSLCAEQFLSGNGDYCVVNRPQTQAIKYYEQGKACYVEGVFYESCPKISYLK